MNKQETSQKILDFCQDRYPEISWEQSSYEQSHRIWGKADGIHVRIDVVGSQIELEPHVVCGLIYASVSSTKTWDAHFKIWLDKKESQFITTPKNHFYRKRPLPDLFIKAKEILSSIFEFIETKIQTEVTP